MSTLRWSKSFRIDKISFQGIFYFFVWGGAVRVALYPGPSIPLKLLAPWAEKIWIITCLITPIIFFISWYLITKSKCNRSNYIGHGFRLGANIGMFLSILAFHVANRLEHDEIRTHSDTGIFIRYMIGAILIYLLILVIKDFAYIVKTERLAIRLRHGK